MARLVILLAAMFVSCSAATDPEIALPPSTSNSDSLIVVFGGSVIPMDRDRVLANYSVVVRQGRIVQISPATEVGALPGARVVDARGKYVMPGLIDMHVHTNREDMPRYLQHGITSVREMWGYTQLPALMADIQAGRVSGPTVYPLSSGFDGSPAKWPQTQIVDDLGQIAPLIDRQVALGFKEIKVYTDLSRAAYDSIVAIARARGLTFAGHVPRRVGLAHVLEQRQRSIEHLGGYELSHIQTQARATAQAGSWNCPTLAIYAIFDPGSRETRGRMVKALHDAGARLLVGTDSGIQQTQPGSSLADELRLFVDAGLSPFEALRGATVSAAEYLGLSDEIGSIKVNSRADLLILNDNPMRDIGAVRRIHGVILRGNFTAHN